MKILYVTRHFNRSGYYILERLIRERKQDLAGIILHKKTNILDIPIISRFYRSFYNIKTGYYGCEPCRFVKSIKQLAKENGIKIIETDDINSEKSRNDILNINPDLILVGGGWHQLLSKKIFSIPKYGTLNVHPSLLPDFRGTDIHRWQILNGVKVSGTTIHYIDEFFDTGNIVGQRKCIVSDDDTPQSLFEKQALDSAIMIPGILDDIEGGIVRTYTQSCRLSKDKYFPAWDWKDEDLRLIDFNESAKNIHDKIRSCNQESYEYVGCYFKFRDKKYFVRKSRIENRPSKGPGIIAVIGDDGFGVGTQTSDNVLYIEKIQSADAFFKFRRAVGACKFVKKHGLRVGDHII